MHVRYRAKHISQRFSANLGTLWKFARKFAFERLVLIIKFSCSQIMSCLCQIYAKQIAVTDLGLEIKHVETSPDLKKSRV